MEVYPGVTCLVNPFRVECDGGLSWLWLINSLLVVLIVVCDGGLSYCYAGCSGDLIYVSRTLGCLGVVFVGF